MTRRAGTIVRVGSSLALVGLVVWWAGGAELGGTLAGVGLGGLAGVAALHTGDRLLMAFKWQRLLAARGLGLPLGQAIRAYYVSSFAGVFLPMTVGADVVRVAALRGGPIGSGTLIASIAVERAIGAVSQAVFCAVSLGLIVAIRAGSEVPVGALAGIVATALLALTLALRVSFGSAEWLASALGERPGLLGKLASLADEYASWRRHPRAIRTFFWLTILEGLFPILTYRVAAAAIGVEVTVVEMAAVVPLVYLLARLPFLGIAGVGPEQAGFAVAAAALVGLTPADGAAISFLVSPIALLLALLPGAVAYVMMRRR